MLVKQQVATSGSMLLSLKIHNHKKHALKTSKFDKIQSIVADLPLADLPLPVADLLVMPGHHCSAT